MSATTASSPWQSLLGSPGSSPGSGTPVIRFTGDAGQRMLQAALPPGAAPLAVYVQATVQSGSVSLTTSRAGVVTPIVDLEPVTGIVNGSPRALSVELPAGASQLLLEARSPGTVIDMETLAIGPADAVGSFMGTANAAGGSTRNASAQTAGARAGDRAAKAEGPPAASTTQAKPAVQPLDTTLGNPPKGTGNGGTLGDSLVSIEIEAATINGAEPGVTGQLHGTYSSGDLVTNPSIGVACAGAITQNVQFDDGVWTATLRFYSAGTKTATATIHGQVGGSEKTDSHGATVTVTLASPTPAFKVTAPVEGVAVKLPEGGTTIVVDAQTNPDFGTRTISAKLDSFPEQNTNASGSVALIVACNGTPIGTRAITVTCSDPGGNVSTVQRSIQLVDDTAPDLHINSPSESQSFVADDTGVTIFVSGPAPDAQSGVASVEWTLSPTGAWTAVDTIDGQGNWQATVALRTFGAFTIYVRATDHAGNQSQDKVTVLVVSAYVPASLEERLDDAHYLFSLLQFAEAEARVGGAGLDDGTLGGVLGQPFDRLSQITPGAASAASESVNELRVPLEILRRQTDAPLVTAYSFEPETVAGSSVSDVADHGDTGTLVGTATIAAPGRFGGQALVVADATSGLRVPSSPRLNVGGGNGDFTAALWVNPDPGAAPAGPGVLLHKGDESTGATDRVIGLFLAADGTIQARTSLVGNLDVGIASSTRTLTPGRWTHVALVRRATRVAPLPGWQPRLKRRFARRSGGGERRSLICRL